MKKILLFLAGFIVLATTLLWVRHGGGAPYPDMSTIPRLSTNATEEVLAYPEPIGNVAVNAEGRLFFTVHPESRPRGNKLLEYVDGAALPYPSGQLQSELFDTVLGVAIDRFDRLWTIDHGNHGVRPARIVGIDLKSGEVLRHQMLDKTIAPVGLFLQDLQVSADGRTIVIADASFWRKKPAIIVYDIDVNGNIFITDVEHGSIHVVGPDRRLATLIQSRSIRWPDALSFGPDGYLYLADSALPDLILRSAEHIEASGPYQIFRLQPGSEGVPGQ